MSRINVNEIVGVGNTHVQILSGLIGDASQLTFPPNIVSFSPDYLEDAAEVNTNITFTFNQPIIFRGTGSVVLRSGSATGSVVQTFSITDGSAGSGLSIVASSQLVINPSSDLSYDTQYYVELNTNPGIANTHGAYYKGDNTYNFKTKLIPFTATGGNYTYTKYDASSPTNYYKYHIFTGSGPLQFSHPSSQAVDLDWMLVAGGATGGSAYSPTYSCRWRWWCWWCADWNWTNDELIVRWLYCNSWWWWCKPCHTLHLQDHLMMEIQVVSVVLLHLVVVMVADIHTQ